MNNSNISIDAIELLNTLKAIKNNPPVKDNSGKKQEFEAFKQGFCAGVDYVYVILEDAVNTIRSYEDSIEESNEGFTS